MFDSQHVQEISSFCRVTLGAHRLLLNKYRGKAKAS